MTKPSLRCFVDETSAPGIGAALNVVIFYNDLPAGQRAMRALEVSASELGREIQFRPQPWRFDFLEDSSWRDFARADVRAADIVFISISKKDALPKWFEDWLNSCLAGKRDMPGAVVALPGSGDATDAGVVGELLWLEQVAREAGWDFVSPSRHENYGATGPKPDGSGQSRLLAGVPELATGVLFERVDSTTNCHWG